jgi:CRP-like cAMP-binding protein
VASAVTTRDSWPAAEPIAPRPGRTGQLYGRGAWFGEAALVNAAPRPFEFRTLAPSVIGFMPAGDFRTALAEHPFFARYLLNLVSHRASRTLQQLLALKHASPVGRIVCTLAHLCESLDPSSAWSPAPAQSARVEVEAGQAELAQACDVSRAQLGGALAALAAAGLVEVSYGHLAFLRCAAWRLLGERLRSDTVFDVARSLAAFIERMG